jgi:hypothetical protein
MIFLWKDAPWNYLQNFKMKWIHLTKWRILSKNNYFKLFSNIVFFAVSQWLSLIFYFDWLVSSRALLMLQNYLGLSDWIESVNIRIKIKYQWKSLRNSKWDDIRKKFKIVIFWKYSSFCQANLFYLKIWWKLMSQCEVGYFVENFATHLFIKKIMFFGRKKKELTIKYWEGHSSWHTR